MMDVMMKGIRMVMRRRRRRRRRERGRCK